MAARNLNNTVLNTKIDYWIKNNQNTLFIGKHGVGKSAIIVDAFERHKLNYQYFSAATLDPWVDFVGIPVKKTENELPAEFKIVKELSQISLDLACKWIENNWKLNEKEAKEIVKYVGKKQSGAEYLDLVRPYNFATGKIEALFFDEFNRAPKKVRNAVMELIQFKSINGMKFPNLKIVWAAINPEDENEANYVYDVEKLDPAQFDRFHVICEMPYKPNTEWFREKYGKRMADSAIEWWEELSDDNKALISPRRLEYALNIHQEHGDMKDILPEKANVSKLFSSIQTGPITEKLEQFMKAKNQDETKKFMANENNYDAAMKHITKSDALIAHFVPLLPKEKIATLLSEDDKIKNYIIHNTDKVQIFKAVCKEIVNANTDAKLVKKIRQIMTENEELSEKFAKDD